MTREEAIKKIKEAMPTMWKDTKEAIQTVIPELFENEDERMLREIKRYLKEQGDKPTGLPNGTVSVSDMIAWLEKRGGRDIDCPQKHQDNSQPNGCIVLEDFNGGEGFYKLNLDYLNKKQVEEVEEMVRTWNKESKASNENIKACIGLCLTDVNNQRFEAYNTNLKDCLDWLEKQKVINTDLLRKEIEKRMRICEGAFDKDYDTYDLDAYYDGKTAAYREMLSFIDSLQQEMWKPSEEQMEAFKKYIEEFQARAEAAVGGWNNFDVMIQLYEQLKKL